MPTDHRPAPAAGTGGAACPSCGSADIVPSGYIMASGFVDACRSCGAGFASQPAPPAPDAMAEPFRAVLGGRDLFLHFRDGTGFVCSPDMPDEAMVDLAAWLNRKFAKAAPQPERVAGGAGLPTVEEMAEAHARLRQVASQILTTVQPTGVLWKDHVTAALVPDNLLLELAEAESAASHLARLASSQDRTADGRVDATTKIPSAPPSETISDTSRRKFTADGRVDADAPKFSPRLEAAIGLLRSAEHSAGNWSEDPQDDGQSDREAAAMDAELRRAIRAEIAAAASRVDAGAVRAYRVAVEGFLSRIPKRILALQFAAEERDCRDRIEKAEAALDAALDRAGDGWRDIAADAARYRHLREHCSSHYPMTHDQPAEWSISWDFQQMLPEHAFGSFDGWIDQDIARQAEEDAEDDRAAPPTAQPETAK